MRPTTIKTNSRTWTSRILAIAATLVASTAFTASAQGFAESCAGIRAANPAAGDGTYVIAPGGNAFLVHCHDMGGAPREYLTLANTGGGSNYSAYGQIVGWPPGNVVTHYTRIRLDPATLRVNIADQTFATSSGYQCCIGPTAAVVSMPYANAASCIGGDDGHANVDLTGTPFKVYDTFTLDGWFPSGSVNGMYLWWGQTVFADTPTVTLTGGGFCGGLGPNPGGNINTDGGFDLQLAYTGGISLDKQSCKSGGWEAFGIFKNQGDCVSFFATQGRNPPAR
jgi:hypothetical protein